LRGREIYVGSDTLDWIVIVPDKTILARVLKANRSQNVALGVGAN